MAYQLPYDRFRNYDELLALQMAEGPLLGLPPMNVDWPAGPLRLIFPFVLVTDLVAQGKALSAAGLLEYLGEVNRQPWHAMWVLRWVLMVLSTAGVCSLVVPIARRTGSMIAGLLGTIMLAAVPTFWQLSVMTMPTALSAALLCCSIAAALGVKQDRGRAGWSGLLMGLAVATKITAVQAAPFVALMALGNARHRWRNFSTWLALVPVGFALGCPFGIAEPVRMLKSIVGNVVLLEAEAGGARAGLLQMADRLNQLIPVWMLILVFGAVAVAVWRRRWWDLIAVSAGFAASALLVLRSPAFSPAYMLPLAPVLTAFSALALGPEMAELLLTANMLRRRAYLAAAVGFVVLMLLAGGREVRS